MFRRTSTCGIPVVDDNCSTYSCGDCVTPSTGSSGSVAVRNSSAASRGHRDELARRNGGQLGAGLVLSQQVAPDQPRVGLADLDKRLPRAVMDDGGHIDAAIGHAVTKNWKVNHQ